jgi:hypothetical protein
MKTFYLFLFITFSFDSSLFSQFREGYIIENNSDTTYGFIDFEGSIQNSGHCKFKSTTDSPVEIYYPGEIKAFRFLDSKYFSTSEIKIDNEIKKVFLEWLIKGRASILIYSPQNTKIRYFFLPENDTLYELQNTPKTIEKMDQGAITTYETTKREYIGTLLYYFKDCPSLTNKIETTAFSSNPLIKIVKEYHEKTCKNEDCIIFEDKNRKLKLDFGLSFGFLASQLILNNNVPEKVNLSHSIGYGVALDISNLPLVSPKFDFSTEVLYFDFLYTYNIGGVYYLTDNRICNIKYLRIPLQLNYKFSDKKLSPFVSLGETTNIRFKYSTYNQYLMNYVTTHSNYSEGVSTIQVGINSGLGLKYLILPKTTIRIKFEYEYGFKFLGTYPAEHSFNNNYLIEASVLFKLN